MIKNNFYNILEEYTKYIDYKKQDEYLLQI